MKIRIPFVPLMLAGLVASSAAQAQFKPKFYPDCYAPLEEARALVPAPPPDIGKAVGTANKALGIASSLGGLGGFGGFGGGTLRAAQTVNTVNQYSGLIADVAAFTSAMQTEFPDLGLRFGAYGGKLGEDADLVTQAGEKVAAGQQCYREAYEALAMAATSGELKKRDIARQHGEIEKGVAYAGEILIDADVRVQQNVKSYNEALGSETSAAGINLGSLLSLAGGNGAMQQLTGTAMPGGVCSAGAWFAVAGAACGVPSPARNADGSLVLGEEAAVDYYEQLNQMSALGAYGRGTGGAGAAAGMLKSLMTESSDTVLDETVLSGLIEAGEMSSRYLVVSQGLVQARTDQAALGSYIANVPTP